MPAVALQQAQIFDLNTIPQQSEGESGDSKVGESDTSKDTRKAVVCEPQKPILKPETQSIDMWLEKNVRVPSRDVDTRMMDIADVTIPAMMTNISESNKLSKNLSSAQQLAESFKNKNIYV